ncbi:MAG: inositol monophosphatase family protein [Rhizobiaceae bacterium]
MADAQELEVQDVDLRNRFECALEIAKKAGELALRYYSGREGLVIESKATLHDLVSVADRNVETLIRERISAAFPEDRMLGEEFGLTGGRSPYLWVFDPIDGTLPFVAGMPSWCVSIAVVKQDEIVAGVVNAPRLDEVYAAARGVGASLNDKPLLLDPLLNIRNTTMGFGANHHASPEVVGGFIRRLLEEGGNFLRNGSGALSLAYVAAGKLGGYYEPYMHAWDCFAGYCLVKEAGGWHIPVRTDDDSLRRGATVIAAAPGTAGDLRRLAGIAA